MKITKNTATARSPSISPRNRITRMKPVAYDARRDARRGGTLPCRAPAMFGHRNACPACRDTPSHAPPPVYLRSARQTPLELVPSSAVCHTSGTEASAMARIGRPPLRWMRDHLDLRRKAVNRGVSSRLRACSPGPSWYPLSVVCAPAPSRFGRAKRAPRAFVAKTSQDWSARESFFYSLCERARTFHVQTPSDHPTQQAMTDPVVFGGPTSDRAPSGWLLFVVNSSPIG